MSKGKGYAFSGTTGDIVHLIQNLPPKPTKEFLEDWNEFVSPKAMGHTKSREFWHKETKLRVRLISDKMACEDLEQKTTGTFTTQTERANSMHISMKTPIRLTMVQIRFTFCRKNKEVIK